MRDEEKASRDGSGKRRVLQGINVRTFFLFFSSFATARSLIFSTITVVAWMMKHCTLARMFIHAL